jgi:hypothetical protein
LKFSHFFIDRPIFAMALSAVIVLAGAVAYFTLPVAQYPDIAPPTVQIQASYPGADPETLAETVATPIEEQVNGVENMLYMSSQMTSNGSVTITVTFSLGTNIDVAQVLVQNRVSIATPRLPQEVQQLGITTRKQSPNLIMVVHLLSKGWRGRRVLRVRLTNPRRVPLQILSRSRRLIFCKPSGGRELADSIDFEVSQAWQDQAKRVANRQLDPIVRKYEEAVNNNDAAAVAALFTEGRGFCHGQRTLLWSGGNREISCRLVQGMAF